jgi:hypothetical protein
MVPAFDDLHRMAQVLLAQHMGAGKVLVLGAGGWNEMAALAAAATRALAMWRSSTTPLPFADLWGLPIKKARRSGPLSALSTHYILAATASQFTNLSKKLIK